MSQKRAEPDVNIQPPGYMQFSSQMSINGLLRSNKLVHSRLNRFLNIVKTYRRDSMYSTDFVPGIPFYIKRWWRWSRFLMLKIFGNSLWTKDLQKDQHVLFLQYEPEITTSLYAYPFKSQKEWIETVLQHIEPGSILYIKEHPAMFSQRDLSFYLFLKKQKQVRLVNPAIPSKSIIQHARSVLTLNSTVGIESVKCGTPVISFGSAYFNFLPQVLKWKELKNNPSWKYLGDLGFPSKEELKNNYQLLEQSIKKIEYGGCLNDHRLDNYVMTSENMSRVKKAIELYVGQD